MVLCGVVGGKRECPRQARENECVVSTATHRQRQWLQSAHTLPREVGLPPSFCWGFLPHHCGQGHVLYSAVCSGSAHPAHIGNGNFYISQHTGWPCRLFPSSCLGMAEAPTSLPWLWYSAMPVSARLMLPLKHEPAFTFRAFSLPQLCPCHSVYEFSPSEETLGEWWPLVEVLCWLCYQVLPIGVHIIQYKLTSVI